ncbi:hypothetical protein [Azonexus hydrophilus]|uniref:hypothetical protein n=1 Tax=Azonexus hydrophilus TaxID=418702 RepID=UPI002493B136|nr:hypothetical protein [Azonexus hydrophilus]
MQNTPASPAPGELTICITPRLYDEWTGSRAQLEAEGFSPPHNDWPAAYGRLNWQASGFHYELRRHRPEGAKGPRKAFAEVDHWCLRRQRADGPGFMAAALWQKRQEIAAMQRQFTPAWRALMVRYCNSQNDPAFQAFKTACGITGKPPRRQTPAIAKGEHHV